MLTSDVKTQLTAVLAVLSVLLAWALAGCTAATPSQSEIAGLARLPITALLPPVPQPQGAAALLPAHSASVLTDFTILGSDYYAKSDAAAVLGTGMELPSDFGQIQWAIYHRVGDGSPLKSLAVDYSSATGNNVWIAVANYSSLSWAIFGPYVTSMAALDLSTAGYESAANDLFFAAISYDGTFITVNSAKVTYDVVPVTYTNDIEPILSANCTGCHQAGGASGGIALDTYTDAMTNANVSFTDIQADLMPPGGPLSAADKALFQAWIDDGLLE